ncbi:MAG: hypothetical protein RL885_21665 [Planctomycetota bacterium]
MKRLGNWALVFVAIVALSTAVSAQDILLRGKVEDVSGTNQFVIDCTNVMLQSNAFNLNNFVGQQTEIVGTNVGTPQAPIINVSAIQVIPRIFEIGGNGKIGREFQLEVAGTPGDRAWIFPASGPGFGPSNSWGTFLLNSINTPIASGVIPGNGLLQIQIPIPNNPALVGRTVYGQALVESNGGLTITLSNADCNTVES